MKTATWLDLGYNQLQGPWCGGCVKVQERNYAHDDGMTYEDSRMYTLKLSECVSEAVDLAYEEEMKGEELEDIQGDEVAGDDFIF